LREYRMLSEYWMPSEQHRNRDPCSLYDRYRHSMTEPHRRPERHPRRHCHGHRRREHRDRDPNGHLVTVPERPEPPGRA
jgi:hypothetical protein